MGDCFSISLNITLKNEAAAVRVMQEYIQNKPYVNFGLEENQKRGIGTDNFNDLIRIFFSSCNGTVIDVARNEDIISLIPGAMKNLIRSLTVLKKHGTPLKRMLVMKQK